jgi:hypothetical protein
MVWQNEVVRIVRFLINDLESLTYTDDRLEETVLVSAQLLLDTMDFAQSYTVDVDQVILTPDPTESPKDNFFINVLALKTACIVIGSEAKTLATQSYRIKDASSSIDISAAYQSLNQLHKQMCDKLDKMIFDYRAGNSLAGQAVLTPYTQEGLNEGQPIRNYE